MRTYETGLGYVVIETNEGLEVTEYGNVVCELWGRSFADYSFDDVIDEDMLEKDIKEQIDVEKFLDENVYC